ncbi:MAG TPA: signal peptidase II [Chryseolinea sp.]|nr:signal peptidase II [Chryseolinea sp.]
MEAKGSLKYVLIVALLCINVSCDQISKKIARDRIGYHQNIRFGDHVTFTKVENSGAFLSFGQYLPETLKVIAFRIFPIIMLIAVASAIVAKRRVSVLSIVGVGFFVGGGVGNIYDRLTYGAVTDFIRIHVWGFHTGIFNMADVSILVGCCLILLDYSITMVARSTHAERIH